MLKGSKKLDFLGIPANWGSGLAEHNRTRYYWPWSWWWWWWYLVNNPSHWGWEVCSRLFYPFSLTFALFRYRFMAMDRLGSDLSKVCERNGDKLKKHTVLQLGCVLVRLVLYYPLHHPLLHITRISPTACPPTAGCPWVYPWQWVCPCRCKEGQPNAWSHRPKQG